MNISTSEYSSGCESGWTMYLDQLSNSSDPYRYSKYDQEGKGTYVNEEDEDLSMVSDASSGPPHFHEYDNSNYYTYTPSVCDDQKKKKKMQKSKVKEPIKPQKQHNLCLDDTASSPFFNFSQGNVPSCDNHNSVEVFPNAHFEGESITKKHLSFFKSSTKGKSGSLLGRKRQ